MESDRHRLERMEGVVSRFEGEISGLRDRVLALETLPDHEIVNRYLESESSEEGPRVVVKRSRKKDA